MQLTVKGQVTVPKKFRDRFNLKPGSSVEFREELGHLILVKSNPHKGVFDSVYGLLKSRKSPDRLVEEMRGR